LGYLRRSVITIWARDKSRPITVIVTMHTSGRICVAQSVHTPHALLPGGLKVVELVAISIFYAHHLYVQILDGKNHTGGRYERFFRDLILDLLNGEETHWGVSGLAANSGTESPKRIRV
jgi:hypothetical protein